MKNTVQVSLTSPPRVRQLVNVDFSVRTKRLILIQGIWQQNLSTYKDISVRQDVQDSRDIWLNYAIYQWYHTDIISAGFDDAYSPDSSDGNRAEDSCTPSFGILIWGLSS